MAKKKTTKTKDVKDVQVEEIAEAPVVEEVTEPPLKLKNPYVTITAEIHSLEPHTWTGVRGPIGKSARAWIRARGLSVDANKVPGVIKEEVEGAGQPFTDKEGNTFQTDLITYRFTEQAIIEADLAVVVPKPKAANDAPKEKAAPTKTIEEAPTAEEVPETATPESW